MSDDKGRVALFITYDPTLVSVEFMAEKITELEGVQSVGIEEESEDPDARRFLNQNERAAATLTAKDVEDWAEHHAGGLYVLIAPLKGEDQYVKMHDSWGDDEKVVVHTYFADDGDDERGTEAYFDTGREALAEFLRVINE